MPSNLILRIFSKRNLAIFSALLVLLIIGILVRFFTPSKGPQVLSLEPTTVSTITPSFTITFEEPVSISDQVLLAAQFIPTTPLDFTFKQNTASLTPSQPLLPSTNYILQLLYQQKVIFSHSFTTPQLDQLSTQDEQYLQQYSDYLYAQEFQKQLEEKPWLKELPITTSRYTIVYDSQLDSIRIRLKVERTPALEAEILNLLRLKSIPTTKITWL